MFERQNNNPFKTLRVGKYSGDKGAIKVKIPSARHIDNNDAEIKWTMNPPQWIKNITEKTKKLCEVSYNKKNKNLVINYTNYWEYNDKTISLEEAINVLLDKTMTPGCWTKNQQFTCWSSPKVSESDYSDSIWINKKGQKNIYNSYNQNKYYTRNKHKYKNG